MTPDQCAANLARAQYGLLSSRDAVLAGLSTDQVADRIATKGWSRHARGLYLLPGAPARSWRQDAMAAVLLGGPDARASHLTSTALHELGAAPLLPHITVPRLGNARAKLSGVHRSTIPVIDRAVVDGIPCTSASRALVEAASIVDRRALEELIDQAICAARATPDSVVAALRRAGRRWPGAVRLRAALDVWSLDIEPGSPAEVRFLRRLLEWGATDVRTQYELRTAAGDFVARVDVAIPDLRQAFEYDSDLFHNARRYDRDEARHEAIEALGWRVDHVSKHDLLPAATRIRDLLRARLLQVSRA